MAFCRICTAPITWSVNEAGERIPLDDHEQRDYGPGRYRIAIDGTPPTIAAVADDSAVRTFVDHRVLCQQPRAI